MSPSVGAALQFQVQARRLLADAKRSAPSLCALGAAQRRYGEPDAALLTYGEALRLDPTVATNAMAHTGVAAVLRGLKRFGESEQRYGEVLTADPTSAHAIAGLAALRLDQFELTGQGRHLAEAAALIDHLPAGSGSYELRGRYRALSSKWR